jgi:hypothetical protein
MSSWSDSSPLDILRYLARGSTTLRQRVLYLRSTPIARSDSGAIEAIRVDHDLRQEATSEAQLTNSRNMVAELIGDIEGAFVAGYAEAPNA